MILRDRYTNMMNDIRDTKKDVFPLQMVLSSKYGSGKRKIAVVGFSSL